MRRHGRGQGGRETAAWSINTTSVMNLRAAPPTHTHILLSNSRLSERKRIQSLRWDFKWRVRKTDMNPPCNGSWGVVWVCLSVSCPNLLPSFLLAVAAGAVLCRAELGPPCRYPPGPPAGVTQCWISEASSLNTLLSSSLLPYEKTSRSGSGEPQSGMENLSCFHHFPSVALTGSCFVAVTAYFHHRWRQMLTVPSDFEVSEVEIQIQKEGETFRCCWCSEHLNYRGLNSNSKHPRCGLAASVSSCAQSTPGTTGSHVTSLSGKTLLACERAQHSMAH